MRRVRAHCTNCDICAGNRCLVFTLAFFPAHSTSLPLFLHLLRVVALITDAHAHFDNREQCNCSRGLVYALSYVGSFGTVCPSVVSYILYQSSGTSRGSLPHCRVPALYYMIKMQSSNVPTAVHSPMGDTTGTIPLHCLLPRKYFVSDTRTSVMMLNLDGYVM